MKAYTYVSEGKFELTEKQKPVLMHERDAIVKITLASICSSDLHIKHGSVPLENVFSVKKATSTIVRMRMEAGPLVVV